MTILAGILYSCASKTTATTVPRVVKSVVKHFDAGANEFSKPQFSYSDKIWYYDSMAIESVSALRIIQSNNEKPVYKDSVMYYRFSDLRKGKVYEYRHFSDTARLVKEYAYSDTSVHQSGGWGFALKRKWNYNGEPVVLKDTVLEGVQYKRLKLLRGEGENASIATCYFRCDKKEDLFVFDSSLSKKVGCPMVRVFSSPKSNAGLRLSLEILFLADSFSNDEQKVFDAWRKNSN